MCVEAVAIHSSGLDIILVSFETNIRNSNDPCIQNQFETVCNKCQDLILASIDCIFKRRGRLKSVPNEMLLTCCKRESISFDAIFLVLVFSHFFSQN